MTATRTEDRLVAALQARAEQVRPEDLTPFVTPEPGAPAAVGRLRARGRGGRGGRRRAVRGGRAAPHVRAGAGAGRPVGEPGAEPVADASAEPTQPAAPKGGCTPARHRRRRRGRAAGRRDHDLSHRTAAPLHRGARVGDTGRGRHVDRHLGGRRGRPGCSSRSTSTATGGSSWCCGPRAATPTYRSSSRTGRAGCSTWPPRTTPAADQQRGRRRPGAPVVVRRAGRMFSARSTQPLGQRNVVQVEVYRWTVKPAPGGGPLLGATRLAGTQCFDLVNDETPHPC